MFGKGQCEGGPCAYMVWVTAFKFVMRRREVTTTLSTTDHNESASSELCDDRARYARGHERGMRQVG